jgi:hypothetical protein
MVEKGKAARLSVYYGSGDPSAPQTGRSLQSWIRCDNAGWQLSLSQPIETDSTNAPGVYDVNLSALETDCSRLEVLVKDPVTTTTVEHLAVSPSQPYVSDFSGEVFAAVYRGAEDALEQQALDDHLNTVADHVLRRGQGASEQSADGDSIGINSLLGVISLMTQGQVVAGPDCHGQYWLTANSALTGQGPLGTLRILKSATTGDVIGVLPTSGPNALSDSEIASCFCDATGTATNATFLPISCTN